MEPCPEIFAEIRPSKQRHTTRQGIVEQGCRYTVALEEKSPGCLGKYTAMADRVLHLSDGQIVKESRNATRVDVSTLQW